MGAGRAGAAWPDAAEEAALPAGVLVVEVLRQRDECAVSAARATTMHEGARVERTRAVWRAAMRSMARVMD